MQKRILNHSLSGMVFPAALAFPSGMGSLA